MADEFLGKFTARTANLIVGAGLDDPDRRARCPANEVGHGWSSTSKMPASTGAEVLVGGGRPETIPPFPKAFTTCPRSLSVATAGHAADETFGPVVPVMVVEDLDEAIERANSLKYGLVCYLYTA